MVEAGERHMIKSGEIDRGRYRNKDRKGER